MKINIWGVNIPLRGDKNAGGVELVLNPFRGVSFVRQKPYEGADFEVDMGKEGEVWEPVETFFGVLVVDMV